MDEEMARWAILHFGRRHGGWMDAMFFEVAVTTGLIYAPAYIDGN